MRTITVGVRMPKELRDTLQKIADDDMITLSNLIHKILVEHLKEHEGIDFKKPKK